MRLIYTAISLIFLHFFSYLSAQDNWIRKCNELIRQEEIRNHIYFLASDEMRGRELGTVEIEHAAKYIADRYKKTGLINPSGLDDYFQKFNLEKVIPADSGVILLDTISWLIKKNFILINGKNIQSAVPVIFAGDGLEKDYQDIDARGKLVLVNGGGEGNKDVMNIFLLVNKKRQAAMQHGAVGVIELIPPVQYPWQMISRFLSDERTEVKLSENNPFYIWLNDDSNSLSKIASSLSGKSAHISIKGMKKNDVPAFNVVGILEGNDPVLRKEYIVVSAHYDHVGVGRPVKGDSIYNGARDNAIGITCLIMSAEFLKTVGSDRSVIFLACTGEEKGLLGSSWYADNPVIPLKETIFDLNTDGAGYNDTSLLTVIDLKRTTIDSIVIKAAGYNGLNVNGDPAPEQLLYDRSDNVSFAKNGVPSVNLSPGLTAFDAEIMKYYHTPQDEPGNLDYNYITKYIKSFVTTLKMLADSKDRPFWLREDVYEKAGLSLYGSRP